MIVREIKEHPELLDNFDWFNDYKDTRSWALTEAPELVDKLDAGMHLQNQSYFAVLRSKICRFALSQEAHPPVSFKFMFIDLADEMALTHPDKRITNEYDD